MLTRIRHAIVLAPLLALHATERPGATDGSPTPMPPSSSCESAAAWVAENIQYVPTTEAGLAPFPLVYRRAIYRALPVATQRDLWKQHFKEFLSSQSGLTSKQRAVVNEAIANVHHFFDPNIDRAARRASIKEFVDRNSIWFPKALQIAVFARLGPAQPVGRTFLSSLAAERVGPLEVDLWRIHAEAAATGFGPRQSDAIVCECHVASQDCPGEECYDGTSICSFTEQGCGPMLEFECDGMCGARGPRNLVVD